MLGGEVESGASLNDFWSFSYSARRWNQIYDRRDDLLGHYESSAAQWPGARHNAFTTTAADGQLWMFGGSGCLPSDSNR